MTNYVEDVMAVDLEERIYPVRENWHLLQPYLNDKEVQAVLNEAMTSFCEQYDREWQPGNPPWEYTTSDYWDMKIFDAIQEDEDFQKEQNELFHQLYGLNSDEDDEDDLWNELLGTEKYQSLENKYFNKYAPKENTMEWYQLIHGCHWINEFTAALISKSFNVKVDVWKTETHTCATFVKDDIVYYADILNEWENLQKLFDFMGDEVDFYTIF